jgi:hypothetical protein
MPITARLASQYHKKPEPERAKAPPSNIVHLATRNQIGWARFEKATRNSRLMVFSMSLALSDAARPSSTQALRRVNGRRGLLAQQLILHCPPAFWFPELRVGLVISVPMTGGSWWIQVIVSLHQRHMAVTE